MLDILAIGLVVTLLALLYLIKRLRALHALLIAPLPRAVTSRGVVPLDPKDRAQYFRQRAADFPKDSPKRKLYEEAAERMSA